MPAFPFLFLSACACSFPASPEVQADLILWQLLTPKSTSAPGSTSSLRIFLTSSTYTPGATLTSVFQADNLCMTDPAYPGSGTFEAMLAAPGDRMPSLPASWVIRAGRNYTDLAGNPLQQADSAGVLPFPWKNPLLPAASAWTGFTASWTAGNNCSAWAGSAGSGEAGQSGESLALALNSASIPCTSSARLICVEQPPPQSLAPLKVFLTLAPARPFVDFASAAGADARCMADSRYPGSGIYKAMIGVPGQRAASSSFFEGDFQLDWVFEAERRYVRASDGAHLQDSNRRRLLPLPLRNAAASGLAWTGLSQFWTSGNNCTNWSSSSGAVFGSVGSPSSQDRFFLSTGGNPCSNTTTQLLCVEQP